MKLTKSQLKALAAAKEHGFVSIGKGYGRDTHTPNAIPAGTYRALVRAGLLTPHSNGDKFTATVMSVYHGKDGYLTKEGKELAEQEGKTP